MFLEQIYRHLSGNRGYLTLWFLQIIGVVVNSYFDPFGGITLDAPWYLKLSMSIAENKGFNVLSPDYIYYQEPHYFHLWPPLYPMMIGLFSKLSTIPVWITYKLVNLILLLFTFKYIYSHCEKNRLALVSLFFLAYIIDMQYQCWSEVPTICLLSIFFVKVYNIIENKSTSTHDFMVIILLQILMVQTRYQLIAVVIVFGCLAWYLRKEGKRLEYIKYAVVGILLSIVEAGYIYINYILPNKVHYSVPFDWSRLKEIIGTAALLMFKQLNFVFCHSITAWYLLPLSLIFGIWFLWKQLSFKALKNPATIMIVLVGFLYILIPLVMRGTNAIGIAHDRFYALFVFCCLFGWIISSEEKRNFKLPIYIFVLFSINIIGKNIYIHQYLKAPTFPERYEVIHNKYKDIPQGAIVVFADKWIEFIRPDVQAVSPYENVMGKLSLPMNAFLEHIKRAGRPIWIEVIKPGDNRVYRYDVSVKLYMEEHRGEDWVKIGI